MTCPASPGQFSLGITSRKLEATARVELANGGFADRSLTTWVRRLANMQY